MKGITLKNHVTIEFLWELIKEYSILDRAQIFKLLKIFTPLSRHQRSILIKRLQALWGITEQQKDERWYISASPLIQIEPYYKQIQCFYVLLDYFDKVEEHFAVGTYSRITMEISNKHFDILYVTSGEEKYCLKHIHDTHADGFFVVVQSKHQISLLQHEKIKAFATITSEGKLQYYSQGCNE